MFGLSNGYLLLIVVTLAIGGLATWYVNSQLKKYTHVPISTGLPGAEAATATACHEVGHACQYAQGYAPMKIRGALVPVVNLASNAWIFLLMMGIFLNIAGLPTAAIVMYAAVVIFQLVTLPVEFNASQRAMAYMNTTGLPQAEQAGSFNVLRACALTYVAAALTSILQLLWLLGQRRD